MTRPDLNRLQEQYTLRIVQDRKEPPLVSSTSTIESSPSPPCSSSPSCLWEAPASLVWAMDRRCSDRKPKVPAHMHCQNHPDAVRLEGPASLSNQYVKPSPEPCNSKPQATFCIRLCTSPNPKPSTLDPKPFSARALGVCRQAKPSTPNPQPSTLNPQPSTLNPQSQTLNPQLSTLNPQAQSLNPKPEDSSCPSAARAAASAAFCAASSSAWPRSNSDCRA